MIQDQKREEICNPSNNETFQEVLKRRVSRRSILKGALMASPLLVVGPSAITSSLLGAKTAEVATPEKLASSPSS